MKIRTFRFYLTEAASNIFKNGWMGVASIFTIFCCLVMFGLFLSLSMNATHIVESVKADYDLPVSVSGSKSHEELNAIAEKIKVIDGVAKINIVTKEKGLELLKQELKEYTSVTEGLDGEGNPLRHTVEVYLTDINRADAIADEIKKIEGVEEIKSRYELRESLISITDFVKAASLWVMIVLVVISIFIISNAIKIAVFTRRKEINIMKFVGATDWFIRWPFLIEGILIGLISCVFAFLLIAVSYNTLAANLNEAAGSLFTLLDFIYVWPLMIVSFVLFSSVLGALGSFISIRKHLKV